jgi:hypothetical protein
MASKEVLTALETLHREIEKLEPAIKHVEMAQQVTQTLKAIPQKNADLLQDIKINDTKHKNDLKNLFVTDLTSLSDENKKLQKTTTEIQLQVKLELEALGKLKETVQSFHERVERINFPEKFNNLDTNLSAMMAEIQSAKIQFDILKQDIYSQLRDIQESQNETRVALERRLKQIEEFIEGINLPERLHKIDSSITGITLSIQLIQSHIDNFERNIMDRLQDIQEYQKESRANIQFGLDQTKKSLQTDLQTESKRQQLLNYITWALVIAATIIPYLIKKYG